MAEVSLTGLFGHDCTVSVLDASANSAFRKRENGKLEEIQW